MELPTRVPPSGSLLPPGRETRSPMQHSLSLTIDASSIDETSLGSSPTPPPLQWWTVLNDKVLHPHFLILISVGGLPIPGKAFMRPGYKLYFYALSFFFVACLIICASRLVVHSAPAYYNIWFVLS